MDPYSTFSKAGMTIILSLDSFMGLDVVDGHVSA